MNRTFKIVGRYSERGPSWAYRGKIGTQAKKHVYTSYDDYRRWGRDTARRWDEYGGLDVEHYELKKGEWKLINKAILDKP